VQKDTKTVKKEYLKLAKGLVTNSVKVTRGDHVLIVTTDVPVDMVNALVDAVVARGGHPHVELRSALVEKNLISKSKKERWEVLNELYLARAKVMDCSIFMIRSDNPYELQDVEHGKVQMQQVLTRPYKDYAVDNIRWCYLIWPSPGSFHRNVDRIVDFPITGETNASDTVPAHEPFQTVGRRANPIPFVKWMTFQTHKLRRTMPQVRKARPKFMGLMFPESLNDSIFVFHSSSGALRVFQHRITSFLVDRCISTQNMVEHPIDQSALPRPGSFSGWLACPPQKGQGSNSTFISPPSQSVR